MNKHLDELVNKCNGKFGTFTDIIKFFEYVNNNVREIDLKNETLGLKKHDLLNFKQEINRLVNCIKNKALECIENYDNQEQRQVNYYGILIDIGCNRFITNFVVKDAEEFLKYAEVKEGNKLWKKLEKYKIDEFIKNAITEYNETSKDIKTLQTAEDLKIRMSDRLKEIENMIAGYDRTVNYFDKYSSPSFNEFKKLFDNIQDKIDYLKVPKVIYKLQNGSLCVKQYDDSLLFLLNNGSCRIKAKRVSYSKGCVLFGLAFQADLKINANDSQTAITKALEKCFKQKVLVEVAKK